jgi:hypothetical protein
MGAIYQNLRTTTLDKSQNQSMSCKELLLNIISAKIKVSCGVSEICADDLKLLSLYSIRISCLQCFNSVLLLPKKKKNRNSAEDFLTSFHNLIENLRNNGFNPSKSSIPVDANVFLVNGAHRLASSIVLSQPICIQHVSCY